MDTLRTADMEVPKRVCVSGVGGRVTLVRAVQGRELERVADEEDGLVVEHPVVVAVGRLELDGPAVEVADRVGGAVFRADGGDAGEQLGLLAEAGEEVGVGDVGDVVGHFEVAACAGSFGVHDPFWDALP